MNWTIVFSLTGIMLPLLTLYVTFIQSKAEAFGLKEYILCLISLVISPILLHIAYLKPARSHTLKTVFGQYKLYMTITWKYWKSSRKLREIMQNATKEQELVLKRILEKQSNTLYGRDHNLSPDLQPSSFRHRHPLTKYSHYETYIEKMVDGEENVLFPEKANFFVTTSGTTSFKCKLYPRNKGTLLKYLMSASETLPGEKLTWPGMNSLGRPLDVRTFFSPREISPGVFRGPLSSISHRPFPFTVSPPAAYRVQNEQISNYVHAFFALRDPDINYMQFLTTSTALSFFRLIEEQWKQLCEDIEQGCLSETLDISAELRQELECGVGPNPQRAAYIRSELQHGCRKMLQKLWPSCRLINATATGAFYPAAKQLKLHYIGDAAIRSSVHVSTEGFYGIGLNNRNRTFGDLEFTIIPHVNFYEFIPEEECHSENPQTVLATEVEVGKVYEIVITSELGLYRFRTEDLVQITRFMEATPSYRFMQRVGEFISLNMFKCPGSVLDEVMDSAERQWDKPIHQYTTAENIHADPILDKVSQTPFFYVFVELIENEILTDTDKEKVHEILLDIYKVYEWSYSKGQIAPPTVLQVTKGTFDEIREITLKLNPDTTSSQYKLNRFTRRQEILDCVLRRLRV